MGGITHHANGRRQPFSDSTTRGFRGETVTLVDTGVVDARPTRLLVSNTQRRPGTFLCGRGHSTPSGTGFLLPNAQHVPGREKMHPHAQNVPAGGECPRPREGCDVDGAERRRSRLASGQIGVSRAATSSSCAAISVKSRSRSRVRTWKRCPVSIHVSQIGGSTAVWA